MGNGGVILIPLSFLGITMHFSGAILAYATKKALHPPADGGVRRVWNLLAECLGSVWIPSVITFNPANDNHQKIRPSEKAKTLAYGA
jgi:hypothetical protein